MVKLPRKFLNWNYFPRRKLIQNILENKIENPAKFFLEFTRHNPTLCTAAEVNGKIIVNGKIVGIGYVPLKERIPECLRIFREHIKISDEKYEKVKGDRKELQKLYREHADRGLRLLLDHIYVSEDKAFETIDFEKMATIELAKRLPQSSKHTWDLIQKNKYVCLVFFQPPSISYEIRGVAEIREEGDYHEIVNLIHDCYHYTPPDARKDRPVYLINVLEVYDNSASPSGFGTKIA